MKYSRADSAWTGVVWYQNTDGDEVGRCKVPCFEKPEATLSPKDNIEFRPFKSSRHTLNIVEPRYSDIGLCDTSPIASDVTWYQLIPHR